MQRVYFCLIVVALLTLCGLLDLRLRLVGGLVVTRLMSGLLFGVSATDLPTFAAGALVVALVAMLACYVPARRASNLHPMAALLGASAGVRRDRSEIPR